MKNLLTIINYQSMMFDMVAELQMGFQDVIVLFSMATFTAHCLKMVVVEVKAHHCHMSQNYSVV